MRSVGRMRWRGSPAQSWPPSARRRMRHWPRPTTLWARWRWSCCAPQRLSLAPSCQATGTILPPHTHTHTLPGRRDGAPSSVWTVARLGQHTSPNTWDEGGVCARAAGVGQQIVGAAASSDHGGAGRRGRTGGAGLGAPSGCPHTVCDVCAGPSWEAVLSTRGAARGRGWGDACVRPPARRRTTMLTWRCCPICCECVRVV